MQQTTVPITPTIVESSKASRRFLEPNDRITETLFGLIMVLTFTGSLSVAEADRAEVRTMLIGALGCNLAWGVIDAVFYLMACLNERGSIIRALHGLRQATTPEKGHQLIADTLPTLVAENLGAAEFETLRRKLILLNDPPTRPRLDKQDWLGGLGIFVWVFISTFPVAIPFIFMTDVSRALRASNGIAITMLFILGFAFGRISGYRPWLTGVSMVILGSILVGMTIALGG
jgi:hypothetical protein